MAEFNIKLHSQTNDDLFPQTKSEIVLVDAQGKTLDVKLGELDARDNQINTLATDAKTVADKANADITQALTDNSNNQTTHGSLKAHLDVIWDELKGSIQLSNQANANANQAIVDAGNATNIANQANQTANNADTKADQAIADSATANQVATQANQTANNALNIANQASNKADQAELTANGASQTANNANQVAQQVQADVQQLTTTINDVKTEVEQARGGQATLKDRIDGLQTSITQTQNIANNANQLAQQVEQTTNNHTTQIGNIQNAQTDHNNRLTALEANQGNVQEIIDARTDMAGAVNNNLSERLESDYNILDGKITANANEIANIRGSVQQATQDATTALNKANANELRIENIEQAMVGYRRI